MLAEHFRGKTVLVTGHTGFKGSWLSQWLVDLGADVVGISLEVDTFPAMFDQLGVRDRVDHNVIDIRDPEPLADTVAAKQPDFVFHLAAQPLVRLSYSDPLTTFATNTMGTVHVLEALRRIEGSCHAVIVTTDKCYENDGRFGPYREGDPFGGHDPYSASKGAAEVVVASYRRSYFDPASFGSDHQVGVASARAGNVIGGGDWAVDRIVPDVMRALAANRPVEVRNPEATRPWQHVLEPLGGYLLLAVRMAEAGTAERREAVFGGFNFGPDPDSTRSVRELVDTILDKWPGSWVDTSDAKKPHEAALLSLAINKAAEVLDWRPHLAFSEAVSMTTEWYQTVASRPRDALKITRGQIRRYQELFATDL